MLPAKVGPIDEGRYGDCNLSLQCPPDPEATWIPASARIWVGGTIVRVQYYIDCGSPNTFSTDLADRSESPSSADSIRKLIKIVVLSKHVRYLSFTLLSFSIWLCPVLKVSAIKGKSLRR